MAAIEWQGRFDSAENESVEYIPFNYQKDPEEGKIVKTSKGPQTILKVDSTRFLLLLHPVRALVPTAYA